jgi:hypothetical protein
MKKDSREKCIKEDCNREQKKGKTKYCGYHQYLNKGQLKKRGTNGIKSENAVESETNGRSNV